MKVLIYSVHYIKPEFIELQYSQLKKYCKNEFELFIVNNSLDKTIENTINQECLRLNLNCVNVENKCPNTFCSQSHNVALEFTLKNCILSSDKNAITVIMDSDIFAYKEFSFLDILNNKKIAGIYQDQYGSQYFSAIFTMFRNDINLSGFSFFSGKGDTGSGTYKLMLENEHELVKHTGALDIESGYIFKNSEVEHPYKEKYRCQFIHDCFIHYYRGSNWAESDPSYHHEKFKFLVYFLNNVELYNLNLTDDVLYETAHSDKNYNAIEHNYNNYRFILNNKI